MPIFLTTIRQRNKFGIDWQHKKRLRVMRDDDRRVWSPRVERNPQRVCATMVIRFQAISSFKPQND